MPFLSTFTRDHKGALHPKLHLLTPAGEAETLHKVWISLQDLRTQLWSNQCSVSWEWAEDQAKRSFMNRVCSKKRPFTVEEEFAYTCRCRPATHSKGTLQPAPVACPILVDSPELEILIVKIRYTALRTPLLWWQILVKNWQCLTGCHKTTGKAAFKGRCVEECPEGTYTGEASLGGHGRMAELQSFGNALNLASS